MTDPNAFDRASPVEDPAWKAAWETEENYWFENFTSRPYSLGPDYFDRFRPGYRYGFESASHDMGRSWDEAEPDLQRGWETYQHKNESTWDEIKHAVKDAWDRITGARTAPAEERRPQPRE